jgi:hypothetical protein
MPKRSQTVIATRRLRLSKGKKVSTLTAKIGLPRRVTAGEWACPFWISDLPGNRVETARGIDAVQAIVLALESIRLKLKTVEGRMSWPGSRDLMDFPQYVPDFFGPEFSERIEKLIAREVQRTLRMLKRLDAPKRGKNTGSVRRKKVA